MGSSLTTVVLNKNYGGAFYLILAHAGPNQAMLTVEDKLQ